jgi:hypothetical protein
LKVDAAPMTASRLLPLLLVIATALFVAGALAERSGSQHDVHASTEAPASHEGAEPGEVREHAHRERGPESERLLGVDLESTTLLILAALAGVALAAASATSPAGDARFMILVALVAMAWTALDAREVVHQLDESRSGVAAIAAGVALLHAAAAALAVRALGTLGRSTQREVSAQ